MNLGPTCTATSTDCFKSAEGVPGQFPAGLRVLVVDDDLTCLKILEKMLLNCHYQVTKSSRAETGLKLLRDNKDGYDIVLSDVHMPDMDGFKLLECVGLEMDLPVIMMSADDSKDVVMKGIIHGACDYLIKPIRMEALKNIWQHVVRRKQQVLKEREFEHSGSEDGERVQRPSEDADCTSSANEGNWKSGSKKRKEEDDEAEERDDTSTLKKPRVVWSVELHQQFVNAVNQLGIDKAVPKKILELMNVPGLTRENVASHLQKYRLYLRRLNLPQPSGIGNTFLGNPDATFGTLSPLHGISVQTLIDQRNIFSFESPKIRFMNGQSQNDSSKQTNLLHGIPTNMDSKQLAALHQSGQSFGNINMHIPSQSNQSSMMMPQMVQPQLRTQLLNKINSGHVLNLQSSLPSGVSNAILGGSGFGNVHLPSYSSVTQPSNIVDFSRSQRLDLPGSFPLMGNSSRNVAFTCSGTAEEEMESEPKGGSGGVLGANFVALNELKRNRTGELDQSSIGPSFESRQQPSLQVRMDIPTSVVVQPTPSQETKTRISNINHQITTSVGHGSSSSSSSSRIKAERFPAMGFQNDPFNDQLEGYDLMSALLKQSEDILPGEHEYNLDSFSLDNHPVYRSKAE